MTCSRSARPRCSAELTRTPRGLRWVRTGYTYQPPALGTYRRRRAACPQGPAYCTYGVRVPASAVLYVPRAVAPQATPGSCSSSRTSSPSTCTCSWASSAAKLCRATGRAPAAATTGSARPLHEKAGSHTSWPSERAAPSGHPWRNYGPCSMLRVLVARELYISNSCVCHCCRFSSCMW